MGVNVLVEGKQCSSECEVKAWSLTISWLVSGKPFITLIETRGSEQIRRGKQQHEGAKQQDERN
jgi:hypothetical protein